LATKEGREKEDSETDLACGFSDRKLQSHSKGKEAFGYIQHDKNILPDSGCVSAREVLLDAIKSKRSTIDSKSCSPSKVSSLLRITSGFSFSQRAIDVHRIKTSSWQVRERIEMTERTLLPLNLAS